MAPFFCESMSLINVSLWADGSGRSSMVQKAIQGISHNCNKQMFRHVVTSDDLLKPAPLDASFSDRGCHLELATAERAGRPCCLPVISTETKDVVLAHSLCPHFTSTHPHARLLLRMLHVKPSRLNSHDQLAHPSPFRVLKRLLIV